MAKSQYYDVSPDTMFQVGDEGKDNYRAGERETLVLPHSIFLSNITAVRSLGQTVTWIAQYHTQKKHDWSSSSTMQHQFLYPICTASIMFRFLDIMKKQIDFTVYVEYQDIKYSLSIQLNCLNKA